MNVHTIFYIDPQSYRNLSIYDYKLLSGIKHDNIWYFHSIYYDYLPLKHVHQRSLFAYNKKKNSLLKAVSYINSYLSILLYIVRLRPQVIHVQWFKLPTFDYWYFKLMRQLFHFKLVHTAHNILPHDTGDRFRLIYQKLYKLSDNIIVHTLSTKKELLQLFSIDESHISVIPHGILQMAIDHKKLSILTPEFNQKYQLNGKIVFTSLGEQTHYKGIDLLSKVWEETPELCQDPNLRLLIIGNNNGIDFSKLEKCANVIVEDRRISDEEFYYLIKCTSVYLLPYIKISQSGAMLTVLAQCTPILVSNVGGLTEPLEIVQVGWKIQPNNPESLRQALLYLKNHPNEIRRIKEDKEAWQHIKNHYDWDNICHKTLALYQQ